VLLETLDCLQTIGCQKNFFIYGAFRFYHTMLTDDIPELDKDDFNSRKREIEQNVENTLDRVVDDYKNHWQGMLGESIQNSYDAWCTNKYDRNVLPEDHELQIEFDINLAERQLIVTDDAGGMPANIFYKKFAGLDTPGDEKVSSKQGGAYGRGFHVVAGLGNKAIAETKHDGFHSGLEVRGKYQAKRDDIDNLEFQGTRIIISDCDVQKLLQLSDKEQVIKHIQGRFQRLLENTDVTVSVTIDGETELIEPVDLSGYEVLYEEDNVTFEHGGDEFELSNIVIYRKENEDIPFRGMSMNKGNALRDGTFMRIKEYRPRQIRHLSKMFGFCDASDLCPEYENNAHNDLKSNIVSATPIKKIFEEIEREEFIGGPTEISERDEIVEAALEILHDNWGENPFETSDDTDSGIDSEEADDLDDLEEGEDVPGGPTTVDTDSGKESSEDSVDEEAEHEPEPLPPSSDEPETEEEVDEEEPAPEISCRTQKRFFEPEEEIELRYTIENPEDSEEIAFSVRGELEYPNEQVEDLENQVKNIEPGEVTGGADGWMRKLDSEGKYIYRVDLYRKGERSEPVDSTYTYFFIGTDGEEEMGTPTVSFIEDVDFFPSDDYSNRHRLQAGEKAMILLVNPSHPEWQYAEKQDGRSKTDHRIATLARWGHEAILNRLLMERVETDLPEETVDSETVETFSDFVSDGYINRLGELSGSAYAGINES